MKISSISAVFFSPTDSTKQVLTQMSSQLPLPAESLDLTANGAREIRRDFSAEELVLFGIPVYGGRAPAPAIERFANLHGHNTPAILVATYGNRAYEDALLELSDCVVQSGFVPFAAAAVITEHSILHSVAAGRPDPQDCAAISEFIKTAWDKIAPAAAPAALSALPGKRPYREYSGLPFKPKATKACTKCGICAKLCPVGAIPAESPNKTDAQLCISCMRCSKVCPQQARKLNALLLRTAEASFQKKCSARLEPEFFF